MTKKQTQTLEEVLHSDRKELPEELRRKLNGTSREQDGEPTQVTKLMEELEECAADAKEELDRTGKLARRMSRLTKHPRSYPKLKLILSSRPPPLSEEGESP